MKVLIYETGKSGHRAVYRERYKYALEQVGIRCVVHHAPAYNRLTGFNQHLQDLALFETCDLIHILTLDDHTRRLFFSSSTLRRTPVIGTYYLYQNISHPIKGWAVKQLFVQKKIDALQVPATMDLLSPGLVSKYSNAIYALPEPAIMRKGIKISKPRAVEILGLPKNWSNDIVVLVFGVLNKRRGIDQIVKFICTSGDQLNKFRFLFAGPLDKQSLDIKTINKLQILEEIGKAKVINKWCHEHEIPTLFSCADLFCIIPEKNFKGASSTVAEAITQRLAVIASKDSTAGQCAKAKGLGFLFDRKDSNDFIKCMNNAAKFILKRTKNSFEEIDRCPLSTDLYDFGLRLSKVYKCIMPQFNLQNSIKD